MYALWVILLYLLMLIIRTIKSSSVWDRLLGMALVSTKLTLLIIIYASMENTAYILDFAIIYTIFGFISIYFISIFILDRRKVPEHDALKEDAESMLGYRDSRNIPRKGDSFIVASKLHSIEHLEE